MQILAHHPFQKDEYSMFGRLETTLRKDMIVKSTSLKPGTPTVSSAVLRGDKCSIKLYYIELPANVHVKDTYDYFVS